MNSESPPTDKETVGRFFTSNAGYLDWEWRHLRRRVEVFLEAQSGELSPNLWLQEAKRQQSERLAALEARRSLFESGVALPMEILSRRWGLRPQEEGLLLVCAAMHLSVRFRQLLLSAQGGQTGDGGELSVQFLTALICPTGAPLSERGWLDVGSTLEQSGLILTLRNQAGSRSRLGQCVYTPHFVAAAIAGSLILDEELDQCAQLQRPQVELFEVIMSAQTRKVVKSLQEAIRGRGATSLNWRMMFAGRPGCGRTLLAEALSKALGRLLLTVRCESLPHRDELEQLLALLSHNATFLDAVLHLDKPEVCLGRGEVYTASLMRLLETYPGPIILETNDAQLLESVLGSKIQTLIEMDEPTHAMREQLWESALSPEVEFDEDLDLSQLAAAHPLSGGQIAAAVAYATAQAENRLHGSRTLSVAGLEQGARLQLRSKLAKLASRSETLLTLSDLILPDDAMSGVRSFVEACRARRQVMEGWGFGQRLATGKGLVALFSGEPGTGKTLCAEILSQELGLELHIVSLPSVLSKWVGETERNIKQLFAEAGASNSMILFDEADALFGKRVRVERAQDHYLNMEVNNLLQEIERFNGIVILTTNLEVNMDEAFSRRILFKLDFPLPDAAGRTAIWRSLTPPEAPVAEDLDFEELGRRFDLSGGQIKNALLRAAFSCITQNSILTFDALEEAAQAESAAAGRLSRTL